MRSCLNKKNSLTIDDNESEWEHPQIIAQVIEKGAHMKGAK